MRCTSARSALEALRNALYKFSRHLLTYSKDVTTMTRAFVVYVRSLLEYASPVWSPYLCMYVCMRAFITRRSYSLSSHECAPKPKRCVFRLLQNNVTVSVGSRSDGGREFHSFGAQTANHHEWQNVGGGDVHWTDH